MGRGPGYCLALNQPLGLRPWPLGLHVSGRSSSGSLLRTLVDYLVFLHLAVERRSIQPENLRGFLLVPVRSLQRLQDRHLLDFRQRAMWRNGELLGRRSLLANLFGQIVRKDFPGLAHQHRTLDGILQLSNIAGPPVANEQMVGGGRNGADRLLISLVELGEEVVTQQRNVFAALP